VRARPSWEWAKMLSRKRCLVSRRNIIVIITTELSLKGMAHARSW
jgi:hypothetical protein